MEQELNNLSQLFLKFPGIGHRQAKRFAYFILTQPQGYVSSLSKTLLEVRQHAQICQECLRIFEGAGSKCAICQNPSRDHTTLIVVEKSQDIDSFDKTEYQGVFFVLGSLIPIIQKENLKNTNLETLLARLKNQTVSEIILAFPLTPNGENTDLAIREIIKRQNLNIQVSSLGRGLSTGAELEYADSASLNASLKKRE